MAFVPVSPRSSLAFQTGTNMNSTTYGIYQPRAYVGSNVPPYSSYSSSHLLSSAQPLSDDIARRWQVDAYGSFIGNRFRKTHSEPPCSPRDVERVGRERANIGLPRKMSPLEEASFEESLKDLQRDFFNDVLRLHRLHLESPTSHMSCRPQLLSTHPEKAMLQTKETQTPATGSSPKKDATTTGDIEGRDEHEPGRESTGSRLGPRNSGFISNNGSIAPREPLPQESVLKRRIERKGVASADDAHDTLRKMDSAFIRAIDASDLRCILGDSSPARKLMDKISEGVRSPHFELLFGMIIVFNTCVMSLGVQYSGMDIGSGLGDYPEPPGWMGTFVKGGDEVCLWFFVAELALKLIGMRLKFFTENAEWNILDAFIVGFSLVDRFVDLDIGVDPMIIRLIRLLKLVRFAKMFKIMAGSLHSMNLILKSVVANISTLFWSMLLLFMIQCVTGILVAQLVSPYIKNESNPMDKRELVWKYYGTMTKVQFTLFEITHVSYAVPARILTDNVGEMWMWFFILYRIFVAFAFLQVIRAVFIQSTLKVASQDRDLVIHQKKAELNQLHEKLRQIYALIDTHQTGSIDLKDFKAVLKHESTKIWLSSLDIDCTYPEGLFELLDLDGTGAINSEEFMYGAAKLRGASTQRDMFTMQALNERIEAKLDLLLPPALRVKKHPTMVLDQSPDIVDLNAIGPIGENGIVTDDREADIPSPSEPITTPRKEYEDAKASWLI